MMARRKVAPANGAETSNQKFVRLGGARVSSFKMRARMVKNLSNYEFTDEQKDKLISEVDKIAADIKTAFNQPKKDPMRDYFSFT
jgi:hypothetical protein